MPFSLADAATSERLLTTAGFVDIGLTAVHEPVYYGPDAEAALDAVLRLRHVSDLLARSADRTQALERLHALLKAHETRDGVQLQSCAWIITSRRR